MTKKIKKQGFRTPYSESVLEGTLETFTGPSMTEPDNSMSIPEIIARYTRGQGIHVRQNPWTVGEASEDGYQVGDGIDPEGFMNFGIQHEPQQQEPQQQEPQQQEPQQQQPQQQQPQQQEPQQQEPVSTK